MYVRLVCFGLRNIILASMGGVPSAVNLQSPKKVAGYGKGKSTKRE
jgi:hypothetical protein